MGGAYTLHPYSGDKSTLPRPLRAVLRIATSSPELLNKFFPHIIIERQEINWDHVFGQDLSDGNTAAIHWAYSIWCGEALTRDPMGFSYSLDRRLALAVIEALMIAWSLDNDGK
jgi:hypothetical protein